MVLFVLSFLGGVLTIISPCILPILPFVFARAERPFLKGTLPMLAGMAVTFAVIAGAATAGGSWIVRANQYGRYVALIVLVIFGLALLWPAFSDRISRPFVQLGNRIASPQDQESNPGVGRSLLLGVATGLLWAPCAGPILGLVLTGAAIAGPGAGTVWLLLTYAAGAATSLAIALFAGKKVFAALKHSLGAEVWIRRALGIAVLASAVAIALGLDRGILTQVSLASTSGLEQSLIDHLQPKPAQQNPGGGAMKGGGTMKGGGMMMSSSAPGGTAAVETMPELSGAVTWLNSPPLTAAGLKGKVVLIDFWTYSCINCLRTLPYIRAWADKYKDDGFVVIGVHTPEFAFEKDVDNVRRAIRQFKITYPVAIDNDYKIWRAFNNSFWPADYLVDAMGHIRYHHFGEGKYDESEEQIRALLKERGAALPANNLVKVSGVGAEAAPNSDVESPETYIGYKRADSFLSPGGLVQDAAHTYKAPAHLEQNQWGLAGNWTDTEESATLNSAPGKIIFRFHARDVHLVLGSQGGKAVRYRVTLDGKAPGDNHGSDTNDKGEGEVKEQRLYQLLRQKDVNDDHTFEIEFLDPGVQAFSFTFG
jgi:cytochrome c biogenesis protein CcdA/thiol-disulfide isomerase/thioredoxin